MSYSFETDSIDGGQWYDPVISAFKIARKLSPSQFALLFAACSLGTSCLAAAIEGRLFSAEPGVAPLRNNFSTLLDFAILNPLALYYVLRSYLAMARMKRLMIKPPPRIISVLVGVVAIIAMWAYVYGFLDGKFFDACYIGGGIKGITATGWIVCFWTTLYVYVLFQSAACQGRYILSVLRLDVEDLDYRPLQVDGAGGIRSLTQPAMEFLRVLVILLITFAGFYLHDEVVYGIVESNRMMIVLPVYLVLAPFLFLVPIFRLHKLMLQARDRILEPLDVRLSIVLQELEGKNAEAEAIQKEMDALAKMDHQIRKFPVWPLPLRQVIESSSYLVGPALTYLPKIIPLIKI